MYCKPAECKPKTCICTSTLLHLNYIFLHHISSLYYLKAGLPLNMTVAKIYCIHFIVFLILTSPSICLQVDRLRRLQYAEFFLSQKASKPRGFGSVTHNHRIGWVLEESCINISWILNEIFLYYFIIIMRAIYRSLCHKTGSRLVSRHNIVILICTCLIGILVNKDLSYIILSYLRRGPY